MRVGVGVAIVLVAVGLAGGVFWFSTVARDIFRDEYDEHARGE